MYLYMFLANISRKLKHQKHLIPWALKAQGDFFTKPQKKPFSIPNKEPFLDKRVVHKEPPF
jgi:hypothetical protein